MPENCCPAALVTAQIDRDHETSKRASPTQNQVIPVGISLGRWEVTESYQHSGCLVLFLGEGG